jgi:hypothetical protein
MPLAEGDAEAIVGDTIAAVAAALLPGAMVSLPVFCTMLLPCAMLGDMLSLVALLRLIVLSRMGLLLLRLGLCLVRLLLPRLGLYLPLRSLLLPAALCSPLPLLLLCLLLRSCLLV